MMVVRCKLAKYLLVVTYERTTTRVARVAMS